MKNLKSIAEVISISVGNVKLGRIPSISLPPILTCNKNAPCTKGDCYALKGCMIYKQVKASYERNLKTYNEDPDKYFYALTRWIEIKKPRFFRIHTAGDFPDQEYVNRLITLCINIPTTKFLAFTKKYNLDYSNLPDNLSIIFSIWPNFDQSLDNNMPKAYMQDGTETRIPNNAIECVGNCEFCSMCLDLKNIGRDVYFHKH